MTAREQLLDELRPGAFALAYRMLGSASEAEDLVQEALLRVHQALDAGETSAVGSARMERPVSRSWSTRWCPPARRRPRRRPPRRPSTPSASPGRTAG
ncbi:MAG TPA: sigma factor [Geodermatophilus sp.]|nr:sigma factor [Geodermatophilus sp.]